jgi:hypothetical protein
VSSAEKGHYCAHLLIKGALPGNIPGLFPYDEIPQKEFLGSRLTIIL